MLVALDFRLIREAFLSASPEWVSRYVKPLVSRVSDLTRAADTSENRRQIFEVMFCEPKSFELMKEFCLSNPEYLKVFQEATGH